MTSLPAYVKKPVIDSISGILKKKWLTFILRLTLTVTLLMLVVRQLNWGDLLQIVKSAHTGWIIFAIVAVLSSHIVYTIATHKMLKCVGVSLGFCPLLTSHFRGLFIAQFLPTAVAADVFRVHGHHSKAEPNRWKYIAWILTTQRLAGLSIASFFLLITGPFVAPNQVHTIGLPLAILVLVAGVAGCGIFYSRRYFQIRALLQRFGVSLMSIFRNKQAIMCLFACSLIQIVFYVSAVWCLARGLQFNLEFFQCFFLVPSAMLVVVIPISLNGLGVREAIYVLVMSGFGFAATDAVALSLGVYSLGILFAFIGGLTWLISTEGDTAVNVESTPT